jgi:hypothetical protein
MVALTTPGQAAPAWPKGLREGMSPAEVRGQLGPPLRRSRQVVSHRVLEHWHYGPPHGLRLTFDCHRGKRPRLVDVLAP